MKKNFLFIFLFLTTCYFSQEKQKINSVLNEINMNNVDYKDCLYYEKKFIIYNLKIIALAILSKKNKEYEKYDLLILIKNNNNITTQSYFKKDYYLSNSKYVNFFSIDKNIYKIKDHTFGFGIKMSYGKEISKNKRNCYEEESIFIQEGNKIINVLKNYEIWKDKLTVGDCGPIFYKEINKYFFVENKKRNGFYDIKIFKEITKVKDINSCDNTKNNLETLITTHKLRFMNGKYQ